MTSQQLNVEKTDLQKMLLCYERIFGKAVRVTVISFNTLCLLLK